MCVYLCVDTIKGTWEEEMLRDREWRLMNYMWQEGRMGNIMMGTGVARRRHGDGERAMGEVEEVQ